MVKMLIAAILVLIWLMFFYLFVISHIRHFSTSAVIKNPHTGECHYATMSYLAFRLSWDSGEESG